MDWTALLGAQFSAATVAVFIIEWLKKTSWFPLLTNASTTKIKALFGALFAALGTAGIGYTFTPDSGTLIVTGLTLAGILAAGIEFVKQWALQELVYRVVKGQNGTKPAVAVIIPPPEV